MLSSVLAAPHAGRADESQSRFDQIDFVHLSAGCGSLSHRDQRKIDSDVPTLGTKFAPAECDSSAVEKYLRQLLYSGLMKPDNGQERSREYIVKNYLTSAPVGGHRDLSISIYVWINEVVDVDRSAPIHLCTYEFAQRISGSNVSALWMRSDPRTIVCGNKSDVTATAIAFAEPLLLDTIAQLRRAK